MKLNFKFNLDLTVNLWFLEFPSFETKQLNINSEDKIKS